MGKKNKQKVQEQKPQAEKGVWMKMVVAALIISGGVFFWRNATPAAVKGPVKYGYQLVSKTPHDPGAYTQGLLVHRGYFYESTGQYGESTVRKVDIASGAVLKQTPLSNDLFGEGLVFYKGVLIQLTWRAGRALVYDSDSLELLREYRYEGEGWGLTTDQTSLILSNGSNVLSFRDPTNFNETRRLVVKEARGAQLNELEFVDGEIWANDYQTFNVMRISPETGELLGIIDFRGLLKSKDRNGREDVLNGIAYDGKRLFVTGKRYSYVYEVTIEKK